MVVFVVLVLFVVFFVVVIIVMSPILSFRNAVFNPKCPLLAIIKKYIKIVLTPKGNISHKNDSAIRLVLQFKVYSL